MDSNPPPPLLLSAKLHNELCRFFSARLTSMILAAGTLYVPGCAPLKCGHTLREVAISPAQFCVFSITPDEIQYGRKFGSVVWLYPPHKVSTDYRLMRWIFDYGASIGCIWHSGKWRRPSQHPLYLSPGRDLSSIDYVYAQVEVASHMTDEAWEIVKAEQCVVPMAQFKVICHHPFSARDATAEEATIYRAKLGI